MRPFNLYESTAVQPEIKLLRDVRERVLGPYGVFAEQISKTRFPPRYEQYSVSLISAIGFNEVIANQLVEGGVDATVFEHFLFRMLEFVRTQERFKGKKVVLLMDNATIHRHFNCIGTVMDMHAILFFNPPYSPQLNPVEIYFKRLKTFIRERHPSTR